MIPMATSSWSLRRTGRSKPSQSTLDENPDSIDGFVGVVKGFDVDRLGQASAWPVGEKGGLVTCLIRENSFDRGIVVLECV